MEWAVAEPMGASFSEFLGQLYEDQENHMLNLPQ